MLLLGKAAMLMSTALVFHRDMSSQEIGRRYPQLIHRYFGRREGVDSRMNCHRLSPVIEEERSAHQIHVPIMFYSCCDCGYLQRRLGRPLHNSRNLCHRYGLRCLRARKDIGRLLLLDANARDETGTKASDGQAWPLGLPAVIRFDQVSKRYKNHRWFASSREVVALEETSLLLEGPGPFGLVGDSGAGKSTFLRLLCGDLASSTGRISIGTSRVNSKSAMDSMDEQASFGGRTAEESKAASSGSTPSKKTIGDQPLESGKHPISVAKPHRGVVYIDRESIRSLTNAENRTVAQALAAAFISRSLSQDQQNRRSKGRQDMEDNAAKILLDATGLNDARGKICRDLSRGKLLCLVLCAGAARAFAESAAYNDLRTDEMLVAKLESDGCEDGKPPGPVLCLDELLETEDPRVRRGVEGVCASLCSVGVTIVFSTHVMDHLEGMLASSAKSVKPNDRGGRVVTFTRGKVGELRRLEACTYVDWKKAEIASRQARRLV